ncbi:MAG: hypothetical protein HY926_01390 [Elusimicrobia bacterium]|nr:hypothetical protein [Elusimicrobiota bacterium]
MSDNGGIRWRMGWVKVKVSMACIGENVGLEEVDNGIWDVYFGSFKLGRLNDRKMEIESPCRKFNQRKV